MASLIDALIPIIAAIVSGLASLLGGILLWLIRDRIQSLEDEIKEDRENRDKVINSLKEEIAKDRENREDEHKIVIKWLVALSRATHDEDMEVDLPEELDHSLDIDE